MAKNKQILFLLLTSFWSLSAFSVSELNLNYGFDRQVYGTNRENKITSEKYGGAWAFYFFNLTAIEFNYSNSQRVTTINTKYVLDANISQTKVQNQVTSSSYGVGIRQALIKKSILTPVISIGYAKQFVKDKTNVTYDYYGSVVTINGASSKSRVDSVYGTFSLKFKLSKRMSLTGSVNTIFPAFEFNKARDSVHYRAGLSWII